MITCDRCGSGVGPFIGGRCAYCRVTSQYVINVAGAPSDQMLETLKGITSDTPVTYVAVKTYEPDADITPFDPPYELSCPLCQSKMSGQVTSKGTFVIVECQGTCRRAWRVPNKGEGHG